MNLHNTYETTQHSCRLFQTVHDMTARFAHLFYPHFFFLHGDGDDQIQATYYAEGEQQGNTPRYYIRDQLGSVRDVIDAQGYPQGALE
jgi:hypothetical protein